MAITRTSLVYFSPTGTSGRVARNIASGVALPVREIDRTFVRTRKEQHHFQRDELVIMALPVYGGRLPPISEDFFAGLSADQSPTVFAVVYGNRHYDDALLELKMAAEQKGFAGIAAGAFIGEHSFTRNVGRARPDFADQDIQSKFGQDIREKLASLENKKPEVSVELKIPGTYPSPRPVLHLQIAPVTNEECVNCQACVEGCPVEAINPDNPREVDARLCISCCYCIKVCPREARHMEHERILATVSRLETTCFIPREAELFI
ncbi:MAG: 4Fe-4S dicluster domain-containing protein [Puniceicoccales bacterium]|jgi:ferredoxin|nr:4Fe-4S dicluster domain-containing protein [Puniceicoccales bacterium]